MPDLIKPKKRILIPIVGQGSISHIIRTGILQNMRAFCEPVVLLLWNQEDLIDELKSLGFEVHITPEFKVDAEYANVRRKINYWYQFFRLKTPSTKIAKNYNLSFRSTKAVIKQKTSERLLWLKLVLNPGYIKKLIATEEKTLLKQDVFATWLNWFNTLQADGIFTVTPFLQEAELLARMLKKKGGLLIASIHSFDNVTKRGWPAIFFDQYFVWNKYNKKELERINPDFKQNNLINITGAPQFDFHYTENFCWPKEEWLQKLKLPACKKIVLYAGGSSNLLPHETQYLKHLVAAANEGLLGENTIILFRCHPLDNIKRWKEQTGESPLLFYDFKPPVERKLDYNNFTLEDIRRLVSTLKYTDVHVSVCSTMTVDGSVFNKPQIAPYYDLVNKSQETGLRAFYDQEHYLPIKKSKVLQFAPSPENLVEKVAKALLNPELYNTNCAECVREIITYENGGAAARVTEHLKKLITQ